MAAERIAALRAVLRNEKLLPATNVVRILRALPRPPVDPATAAVALWSGLHGVVALRTAKPAYPWPPLPAHVDAVLEPYLR